MHRERRLIRDGEIFNSDEIDNEGAQLEKPPRRPEPTGDGAMSEPWGRLSDRATPLRIRRWARRRLRDGR